MKKIVLGLLSIALLAGISNEAIAQKKYKEGKIAYKVSFPELPEEAQAMAGMMPNKMEVFFTKEFSRVEMKGGMVNNTTIIDIKGEKATNLINMMGQKIATEIDLGEAKKEAAEMEQPKIEKVEGSKTILGYECKKALIKTAQGDMEVYYTDAIEVSMKTNQSDTFEGLEGFPMEYTMTIPQQQMKMMMTVTEISKDKPSASLFEIPEGYKKMTQEEMQKSMGGGF